MGSYAHRKGLTTHYMAKYRIAITNIEDGFIDVEAESLNDAMDKAYTLDGDYYAYNNEVVNASYLETVKE